ncbi:hypothetical protein [Microbacterium candidum]|uniref:Uncharacterized protein n=1 Tax=Microbacterium candidum TaxID=3041922 RepID=A0ABT7MVU2_9MICO|nr:hypothetical protein [Microbacterium sp. ASV49]MDL9978567.1 hypothetical protein [Microbacterium sp. ASV49]
MNTFSNIWSRRRNRVIAAVVGAGIAGVAVIGGTVADANASTGAASTTAVVPAAATTPAPSAGTAKADAARLRAAMKGIRALPAAQRPAAFLQLKADVLAGKYGLRAKRDLAAIDAVVASNPAGLRGALLRLAEAHPPVAKKASGSGSSLPTPAPTVTPSA